MKPLRGKRLALRVCNMDTTTQLLEKATEKWKLYCPECFEDDELYTLCYENSAECILMPGNEEPFNLKKYRYELGKDYKRIVLYLCPSSDKEIVWKMSNKRRKSLMDDSESDDNQEINKRTRTVDNDHILVKQLQQDEESVSPSTSAFVLEKSNNSEPVVVTKLEDIIKELESNVDTNKTFDLHVRRGATLQRNLSLFQRGCKKNSPTQRLSIKYLGESVLILVLFVKSSLKTQSLI